MFLGFLYAHIMVNKLFTLFVKKIKNIIMTCWLFCMKNICCSSLAGGGDRMFKFSKYRDQHRYPLLNLIENLDCLRKLSMSAFWLFPISWKVPIPVIALQSRNFSFSFWFSFRQKKDILTFNTELSNSLWNNNW